MFKKNTWIAVLLIALVMMFVGCIDPVQEEEGEIVEIFRLSKVIADVPDGLITDFESVFANTPIQKCGGLNFSIITEKGVKKLKLDGMTQTWGEGLDLMNADDASKKITGVNFRAGDKITIKGTADPVGIYMNLKGGAHGASDNWQSDTVEIDHSLTLDAAMVGTIRTGSPQVIRIHYHDGKGDSRKGVIVFEEIVVEGSRSGTEDVFIDDFEISARLQVENWVEGLTITPKKGKSAGKITQYFEGDDVTYAKSTTVPQAVGVYKVTFDVAAAKGFNAGTGFDAGNMKVLATIPPAKTNNNPNVKLLNGGAWDNAAGHEDLEDKIKGPDGVKDWILIYSQLPSSIDWSAVMPVALRGFTVNSTPRYILDFDTSTPANWKDYEEFTITFSIIKTDIQTGADGDKAQLIARRNQGTFAWADGDIDYPEYALGAGVNTFSRTYKVADVDNAGSTVTGIMFGGNNKTAFLMKILSIKYHNEGEGE